MDKLIQDNIKKENKPSEAGQNRRFLYAISLGAELGFLIAVPMVLFLLLGLYLDKKFNTLPVFLISMVILCMITTIFEVRNLILPFLEKRSQNKKNNKN
jgi:F0F1-type ATP synthase assembly protein I